MNRFQQYDNGRVVTRPIRNAQDSGQSPVVDINADTNGSNDGTDGIAEVQRTKSLPETEKIPVVPMAHTAYEAILQCIAFRPAESGGILLGPIGRNEVTEFHFDQNGSCTSASYTPDHIGLGRRLKQDWLPSGIDFKGFVHSHPGRLDWLTGGDLRYIERLLRANDDMDLFVAPIVIPPEFRIRPIVVLRTDVRRPRQARLALY